MKKKKFDINNIPSEVLYLLACKHFGMPVGVGFYEETVKKYPEHFPEEFKRMNAWNSIPKEVHDDYWKEHEELDKELRADEPEGCGIWEQMNNTDKAKNWNDWYKSYYPKYEAMEKKLHSKYYSRFGIK